MGQNGPLVALHELSAEPVEEVEPVECHLLKIKEWHKIVASTAAEAFSHTFETLIESLFEDSNLSNAVLMSLGKESEAHGTFETMVVQQLDSEVTKLVEQVTRDIESGDEEQVKSTSSTLATMV